MTYKFGVKGSVKNPYEKIEEYVVGILGFEKVEGASNTYTGNIPALATYRKGDRKMLYSGDVTVKFTYDGYTVTGVFSYPYIIETVTICDNNQTVIENHLQKADMTKAVFKQVDHYTEDHMDQIRNYVNRQNRDLPSTPDLTTFMKMQYTVEDEQVSYYSIIPSKNNLTAAQLYAIAERWYTYSYRSGKAVIEVRDKDNYIITGKGIYERIFDDDGHKVDFPHIFSIQCRDGRVRAVVSIGLIDWRDEDGDFHRVKIVDYQPFGDDKEKWSMKSIEEAEKIIAEQFAELQKAFDEGLNAVENKDDW
jgi:inorganic pyrophosphatase